MMKAVSPIVRMLGFLILAASFSPVAAQVFDANTYYQQCLRFERGGDYETAQQSCLNAIEVEPDFSEAKLALARIETELGNFGAAEQRLNQIRDRLESAEPYVLLADIALQTGRPQESESFLQTAERRLNQAFDIELEGKRRFLAGQLAERAARYSEALEDYQAAIETDSLSLRYVLADARLRFKLGDLERAQRELEAYQNFTGDTENADLLSLLGRVKWAQSSFEDAANDLETAVVRRSSRENEALTDDLRSLAFIYYGQGDMRTGNAALREAMRRSDLLLFLLSNIAPWLALLVLTCGIHLFAESRIESRTTLEVVETPRTWSVGQVYGSLMTALVLAAIAAFAYGIVVYSNYLSIVTPLQSGEFRAVFFGVLALSLAILIIGRVRRYGWDPLDSLVGTAQGAPLGILVGLGLLAITVAYKMYMPEAAWLQTFYLDFSRLTPLLIAAVVLIPLSELFFRAFALPAFQHRYDRNTALALSSALYALVFATPIVLLVVIGLALSEIFRRNPNGLTPLVAQLVFHIGLAAAVAFIPFVHGLFLG